jgi:peptidoglycan/LPS O-acetylase OafA/YrhL
VRALDGVRGLAVLLVVAAHTLGTTFEKLSGIGVGIFFVLSGFLITGLLLAEDDANGTIHLRDFYIRRSLRLFPALAALLLLVSVLPWYFTGEGATTKPEALAYAALYAANMTSLDLGYLNHTWSLATEEQFYLLWPIMLMWLLRRDRVAVALCCAIPVVTLLRIATASTAGDALSHTLLHRADQLMLGALLAVLMRRGTAERWVRPIAVGFVTVGTLGVIFLAGSTLPSSAFVLGLDTVVGVATVLLIGHLIVNVRSGVTRMFSVPWLVLVGKVSYGIYLYHWPVVRGVGHLFRDQGWVGFEFNVLRVLVDIALTTLLVWLSWRFVETPALKLKERFAPRRERAEATRAALTGD